MSGNELLLKWEVQNSRWQAKLDALEALVDAYLKSTFETRD